VKLAIALDAEVVTPGDRLSGRVHVEEGGESRSLTLAVRFCERSPSYMAVPFSSGGVIHEGNLVTGQAVAFEHDVPDWALPGVKTGHAELYWEIEAVSDEPGFDTRLQRRFEVARPTQPA
jgi:hypothetical protein